MPVPAAQGKAASSGLFEPGLASFANDLTSSLVFVIRRHVADALVQADAVVVLAGDVSSAQGGRVADREQMWTRP